MKSLEKYYAVDTGFHYFMLGNKTGNEGFILENIVYLELLRRELKPLKAIKDSYPKFLITLDECNEISHDGIRQLYALDWLCNKG